eukprot:336573-Pleurochrysis_carterae.AAC.2
MHLSPTGTQCLVAACCCLEHRVHPLGHCARRLCVRNRSSERSGQQLLNVVLNCRRLAIVAVAQPRDHLLEPKRWRVLVISLNIRSGDQSATSLIRGRFDSAQPIRVFAAGKKMGGRCVERASPAKHFSSWDA